LLSRAASYQALLLERLYEAQIKVTMPLPHTFFEIRVLPHRFDDLLQPAKATAEVVDILFRESLFLLRT
ncbi:hypothetical protein MMC13_003078, partial [Lambiella insularis]|nr:hypothetical protein [Lambiella insularis]